MSGEQQPAAQVTPPAVPVEPKETTVTTPAASAAAAPVVETTKETDLNATPAEERVVPEKYELKLSEGSLLDSGSIDRFAAIAKANGMTQAEAEDFVKLQEADVSSFITERKNAWKAASVADKEIGGDKLTENVALSNRVIDKYATPALKAELNKTGYGNHPEIVRMFARIGKEMAEDKAILPGTQSGVKEMPLTDIFYPEKKQA